MTRLTLTCLALIAFAFPALAHEPPSQIQSIYWNDADSGWINGKRDGYAFRLANIDAPETRSMKQQGGAKCEPERAIGYKAKAWVIRATRNAPTAITSDYGHDRYGRHVIDMSVYGRDLGGMGTRAGIYQAWPHRDKRALTVKPSWCGENSFK